MAGEGAYPPGVTGKMIDALEGKRCPYEFKCRDGNEIRELCEYCYFMMDEIPFTDEDDFTEDDFETEE